jgi:hypothetical protein
MTSFQTLTLQIFRGLDAASVDSEIGTFGVAESCKESVVGAGAGFALQFLQTKYFAR